MPLVKIELAGGRDRSELSRMRSLVSDCVVDSLKLPADDRNVRLVEHDPDLFSMKPPYSLLIEITMFAGRSRETKKALYRRIVQTLHREMDIPAESVFIVLNEQPLENWGVKGGVPADEVGFDFKIEI
jgi:phenylpyruvate tautomerase PptA (4-oxalocrotonate tautomerase family)